MDGIAKPDLIVDGYASPHGFAMKPSHAKMLQNADLIFWVGEDLESFLEKPLNSIAKKAEKIELMDIKGLNVLSFRERNIFDEHDDHDDHEGHTKKKKDEHDDHEGHGHGEYDPHIWLDPINAKVILKEMTEHLIENDSKNASTYKSNLDKALKDYYIRRERSTTRFNFTSTCVVADIICPRPVVHLPDLCLDAQLINYFLILL